MAAYLTVWGWVERTKMWARPDAVPSILTFRVRLATSAVHRLLTFGWLATSGRSMLMFVLDVVTSRTSSKSFAKTSPEAGDSVGVMKSSSAGIQPMGH